MAHSQPSNAWSDNHKGQEGTGSGRANWDHHMTICLRPQERAERYHGEILRRGYNGPMVYGLVKEARLIRVMA